ncbi:MMPL/RND family transporter [Mycolicibacterium arseniciresistens]|uniref:RND family transporter n=1 Tax=Mycolicibacterium arseniciresistens TaxID=3062257 RepID=A0ABT8UF93_9MYCO|nr:RND family transporter [Mycolicibacterium arseniciresistens]MDO3635490.1 RND family transporter [Mycolicibacterium arseniciresistens]
MISTEQRRRPWIARTIRTLAPLIVLAWLAVIVFTTLVAVGGDWRSVIPSLEKVAEENSVSLMPADAPSAEGMLRMGQAFEESDSDSSAMIVLEGQDPLGEDARQYYAGLIKELRADSAHVTNVQDLWGDRLTSSSVQSPDGKATYVQINLAGNQGTPLGDESVEAVRGIVDRSSPPPGVKVYVSGAAPLASDMQHSGNDSILKITIVTVVIIFTMLLIVYRSIMTVILLLLMVGIELAAARGVVALLGANDVFVLSTFAVNMLVFLAIAAGTDYGIFFFGRYQEARQAGEDRESAYYTTYRSTAPVVLASGLTIAGAILCLSFTRLPYFNTMGIPCAIGMLVAVAVAVTLVPAGIAICGRIGLLDPKRKLKSGRWRGIGTAIVRWPGPILVASLAVALVGLLALPGYQTNYNDRAYISPEIPANQGFAAAERHFSQARLTPDILMIESDHDLRNPTDFITLNKLAKEIFKVQGVSRVQGITRPEGTPIAKTSIPFLISLQSAGQVQSQKFQAERNKDMLKQAEDMGVMIGVMQQQYEVTRQLNEITYSMIDNTKELQALTDELTESIGLFQDFFRPIQNYFYWEKKCYNIPICWALRSVFDTLDGISALSEKLDVIVNEMEKLRVLLPQLLEVFPQMIDVMRAIQNMSFKTYSTMSGISAQMDETSDDVSAMGQAFDAAKNDDSFFLPPEVFENPDFKRAMDNFLSPDGKAARFIISHNDDPATPEGIARIERVQLVAEEALKGTPLESSRIYLSGTASTAKDWNDGSTYDLLIAGIAAICLVFIIMLVITRSFIAALVIVGTVVLSLGASFGLAVLLWQYILGIQLHWMVLAMSVIILLAVGSDYNLLLVSRMKEEVGAGINTGIIRAMGGTGKVVTTAGLVFAATMASMAVSDLRIIGQIGTTIGLGLLFDTMIVRSFMTPSIAALLGRWFWWPQRVRPRPASTMLRPYGPRPLVRALLGIEQRRDDDDAPTTEIPRLSP